MLFLEKPMKTIIVSSVLSLYDMSIVIQHILENFLEPWKYDKVRYNQRNEIERYFLRLKRFRKIFTRYDKLDVLFCGFIFSAMIIDAVNSGNRL